MQSREVEDGRIHDESKIKSNLMLLKLLVCVSFLLSSEFFYQHRQSIKCFFYSV